MLSHADRGGPGHPLACLSESLVDVRVREPKISELASQLSLRPTDTRIEANLGQARFLVRQCKPFALSRLYPGFPFCLPRMAPLYTREPPIPRNFLRRTIVQLRRPSPQPPLTCNRLEPPTFRAFLRHRSTLVAFLRQAGFVALAARQPPGTGSAQILRSMSPNSRRVRCPSANRSQ